MKTIQLIELDDVICPDDYMRPLNKCPHYDCWMPINVYGGSPLDTMKWYPVKYGVGNCWYGLTWREFYNGRQPDYEVVRGDIPKRHTLKRIESKGNYSYITDK